MNKSDRVGIVRVYMMRGLPRSGKSTLAKSLSEDLAAPIVSRDAARFARHQSNYIESLEPEVKSDVETTLHNLIFSGNRTIIFDGCHVDKKEAQDYIEDFFRRMNALPETNLKLDLIWVPVLTPESECIKRAIECGQEYLVPVIKEMKSNWRG